LRRSLRIASSRLFRPQDARRAAEQILAEVGFDEEADAALEQILTQTKAWPDLAKLLHGRADRAADVADRVRLLVKIAQLEEARLADREATFASYREVLQANAYAAAAVSGLERLVAAGYPDRALVARLVLPFYERAGDAGKLAAANEALLAVADTRGEKVERLEQLRTLYGGPLGDAPGAYRTSLALFQIDPTEVEN